MSERSRSFEELTESVLFIVFQDEQIQQLLKDVKELKQQVKELKEQLK